MAPMDSPSSSPRRGHSDYFNSSPRRGRRTYTTDAASCAIDPNGHKEKLPRPSPGLADVYDVKDAENASSTPKKAASNDTLLAEKNAHQQYLWPTTEAVFVRHANIQSPIPLAVQCTPFADSADSTALPLSQLGAEEPLRCFRCRAYVNAHWKKVYRDPSRMQCNMCGHSFELPKSVLADMERTGHCADMENHPELAYGSVDFTTPSGSRSGPEALPFVTCFAVDTSAAAVRSGFSLSVLQALRHALQQPAGASLRRQVCLVTFNDVVTFYARTRSGRFRAVSMREVETPFLPVSPLVMAADMRVEEEAQGFLSLLEAVQEHLSCEEADMGKVTMSEAALQSCVEAVTEYGGGDLITFLGSPCAAVGSLGAPGAAEERKASSASSSQVEQQREELLRLCTQGKVAVSTVTAPPAGLQLDVPALQWLPWRTGGDVLHLPAYSEACREHLQGTILHWLVKMQASAYACTLKLRCSKGLSCKSLIAPWKASPSSSDQSQFELPRLCPDSCVTFMLEPDNEPETDEDLNWGRRDTRRQLFVQVAVLYTNTHGERLLRVHTTMVGVSPTVKALCQSTYVAPVVATVLKQAVATWLEQKPGSKLLPRDVLLEFCLQVLAVYRRNSSMSESGRPALVISKRLSLLPLYILAARKLLYYITDSPDHKGCEEEHLRRLLRMPVHSIAAALYPRVYPLPAETGEGAELPQPCLTLQEQVLQGSSPAYLITNGFAAWFCDINAAGGCSPSPKTVEWPSSPQSPGSNGVGKPPNTQELRQNAEELCEMLRGALDPSPGWMPLRDLPKPQSKTPQGNSAMPWQDQVLLSMLFVEDEGVTEMSYADWIQFLHANVLRMDD